MPTDKQKVAWERNHLIMRLRGAYSLFLVLRGSSIYGVAVMQMSRRLMADIDQVLIAMGAESEAGRSKQRRKQLEMYP